MFTILSWLGLAVSVVVFLGAVTVYLRGSKDKGTIETLERNNKALAERVALLEPLIERVALLERENAVLRTVDSAKEEIASLRGDLSTHHSQAMDGLAQLHADLTALRGKP